MQHLWSTDSVTARSCLGSACIRRLDGNRLYVLGEHGNVLAIDATTGRHCGKPVPWWKSEGGRWKFWNQPHHRGGVTGGPGFGGNGRGGRAQWRSRRADAETGSKRWTAKGDFGGIEAPLVKADRVVVRSNDGRGVRFDVADGTRKG